ncbi:MAG: hypothetical protein ABJA81_06760 [Nocardioidaceae bacterium]
MTGPITYWHVDNIEKTIAELVDAGAAPNDAARDVGGGTSSPPVKDADGNVIGLFQSA